MYEITTESHFSAAHCLRNYHGPCENLHGHNWVVRVSVLCGELDNSGLGMDFKVLKKKLNDILDDFDHRNLNDIFDSLGKSPSSEFIARLIYERLTDSLEGSGVKVSRVSVQETPGNWATYYELN